MNTIFLVLSTVYLIGMVAFGAVILSTIYGIIREIPDWYQLTRKDLRIARAVMVRRGEAAEK